MGTFMRKTVKAVITVAMMMGGASPASAQYSDYQATSDKLTICKSHSLKAQLAYVLKQKGDPKPDAGPMDYVYPIRQAAIDFGYNKATSQMEADKVAWAYCMDNLDRVTRDEQARLRSR